MTLAAIPSPNELARGGEQKPCRGRGSVYQRGTIWWLRYQVRGRSICESSRTTDRAVAEKILAQRIADRDRRETRRRARLAAAHHMSDELTMVDLLSYSVRTLIAEMRKLGRPIPAVYFLKSAEFIKIGYAADFDARLRELQVGNPVELELLGLLPGPPALEHRIHAAFSDQRERGEWFRAEGRLTEFLADLKLIYETPALFHSALNEISHNGKA
jgi:hypothetical protein